jgi:hypothetical protein
MLVYFMAIWSILRSFGLFCGHLVYVEVIWYIFPRFGMLYQEKSGHLAFQLCLRTHEDTNTTPYGKEELCHEGRLAREGL